MEMPPKYDFEDQWRLCPDVAVQNTEDGSVLLDLKKGMYFGLNFVGMEILNLIVDGHDFQSISLAIANQYDDDREILISDITSLIHSLESNYLISRIESRKQNEQAL